ncbi:hypothetical protein IY145_17805 [Methylosinus sp. H3A]|uniref:hypothetical protein n=1 Tax=Methylosinus sp. H3A TaxID=2785786 RepID=UPI0018C2353F|nr:hypothetical protein [Methylosinus sp. H3A]MBG0811214.1 hypothetical protein [Methylosinus sp. H3A]
MAIKKFEALGSRRSEAPTPERLMRAGGAAKVERFADTAVVVNGSRAAEVEIEAVRVVVADDPFTKLCNGGHVHKKPGRNLQLCTAGIRYREVWRQASQGGAIRGPSWNERVQGGRSPGLFGSESAAQSLLKFTKMRAAIGDRDHQKAVEAIVLEDRPPEDVGREISGYAAPAPARAVSMHALRRGLEALARHLGLIEPEREEPAPLPRAAE